MFYLVTSSHENMSRAALLALQLLEVGLSKQEAFLMQLKAHNNIGAREINVTPLDELMMGINPHSSQADHLINVTKLVFLMCISVVLRTKWTIFSEILNCTIVLEMPMLLYK